MTYLRDDEYDPPEQWHVYYCYADDALIYVGCSRHPAERIRQHSSIPGSAFIRYCTEIVISEAMRRSDAFDLERAQIRTHGPQFNSEHNWNPKPWRDLQAAAGLITVRWTDGSQHIESTPTERKSA